MNEQIQILLKQMREEDSERVFRRIFDLQYDRFYRIAYYYVQEEEWAKDIALDVLADLWNKRHEMVVPRNWEHFSFTMVRNRALNLLEREQRHQHEAIPTSDTMIEDAPGLDERLENAKLFEAYEAALGQLSDRCREIFVSIKEEGQSYAEVADRMGISTKTVDAQIQKTLKFLREAIGNFR